MTAADICDAAEALLLSAMCFFCGSAGYAFARGEGDIVAVSLISAGLCLIAQLAVREVRSEVPK